MPDRDLLQTHREQAFRTAQSIGDGVREAVSNIEEGPAGWREFAGALALIEMQLGALRFNGNRIALDKRPETLAFRAREMARVLSDWADALDDPDLASERRAHLTRAIEKLKIAVARAASGLHPHALDATYLRAAFCEVVQQVADMARKEWKETLPPVGKDHWLVLADEVIRIYGEGLDPARVPAMRRLRTKIAKGVESCSNRGGRGKRAALPKSGVLPELCVELGFPSADYDSIRVSGRRKGTKKQV